MGCGPCKGGRDSRSGRTRQGALQFPPAQTRRACAGEAETQSPPLPSRRRIEATARQTGRSTQRERVLRQRRTRRVARRMYRTQAARSGATGRWRRSSAPRAARPARGFRRAEDMGDGAADGAFHPARAGLAPTANALRRPPHVPDAVRAARRDRTRAAFLRAEESKQRRGRRGVPPGASGSCANGERAASPAACTGRNPRGPARHDAGGVPPRAAPRGRRAVSVAPKIWATARQNDYGQRITFML